MTTKKRTLMVRGMTCHHCEMSVREELEELGGVKSVGADHETGRVELEYDEARVTDGQLREAVEEAGYILEA